MILFDIDESCRDVCRVDSKVRYMISLVGFFRFEGVYVSHDCIVICLKKERCQRQTVRAMVTATFYLLLWLDFHGMDVNKQSVLFRSSLVVISYIHFFIIAYKLH